MVHKKPRFGGAHNMETRYYEHLRREGTSTNRMEGHSEERLSGTESQKENEAPTLDGYEQRQNGLSGGTVQEKDSTGAVCAGKQLQKSDAEQNPELYCQCTQDNTVQEEESNRDPACLVSAGCSDQSSGETENINSLENTNDLKQLLQVFKDLGIETRPKLYTRREGREPDLEEDTASLRTTELECHAQQPAKASESLSSCTEMRSSKSEEKCPFSKNDDEIVYCKNLFLKDRKGQFYLIITDEDTQVDLKILKQQLNAHRNLSFGDAVGLREVLKLEPGSVTPLALMHESARDVRVAIQTRLKECQGGTALLAFHPLDGTLQVEITVDELRRFVENFGKTLEVLADRYIDDVKDVDGKKPASKRKHRTPDSTTRNTQKKNEIKNKCMTHFIKEDSPFASFVTDTQKGIKSGSAEDTHLGSSSLMYTEGSTKARDLYATPDLQVNPSSKYENQPFTERKAGYSVAESITNIGKVTKAIDNQPILSSEDCQEEIMNHIERQNRAQRRTATSTIRNSLIQAHHRDRKGKLRSYIKKVCKVQPEDSTTGNHGQDVTDGTQLAPPVPQNQESEFACKTDKHSSSSPESKPNTSQRPLRTTNPLNQSNATDVRIESKTCSTEKRIVLESHNILPEIYDFIQSLKKHDVSYKDVELSFSDSHQLGPSVGCRCFLLRDRRDNYFFIVSHEFYELDHGRLKKALRPRKKLDVAQPEEIMAVLGVDPTRLTPFAYVNVRSKPVRIFFTEKIQLGDLILCIQHPFARGHRIVIKSSELERYLTVTGAEIETVEEKYWPAKFNIVFSQFEQKETIIDSQRAPSGETTSAQNPGSHEEQMNFTGPTESLDDMRASEELNAKQKCDRKKNNRHDSLLSSILEQLPFTIPRIWTYVSKLLTNQSQCPVSLDSSVDPVPETKRASNLGSSDSSQIERTTERIRSNQIEAIVNDKDRPCSDQHPEKSLGGEKKDERQANALLELCLRVNSARRSGGTSSQWPAASADLVKRETNTEPDFSKNLHRLGIDDILKHLNEHGVSYHIRTNQHRPNTVLNEKDAQTIEYTSQYVQKITTGKSRQAIPLQTNRHSSSAHPITTLDGLNDFKEGSLDSSTEETDSEEPSEPESRLSSNITAGNRRDLIGGDLHDAGSADSDSDDENSENCRLVHMYDNFGTSYIVIGGESDFITIKRFSRRFGISTRLELSHESTHAPNTGNVSRLTETPFSIACLNHSSMTSAARDIKVVLTTSIYIDPSTVLKFVVDNKGSVLVMTAEEFETFSRKVGFDVWYMP